MYLFAILQGWSVNQVTGIIQIKPRSHLSPTSAKVSPIAEIISVPGSLQQCHHSVSSTGRGIYTDSSQHFTTARTHSLNDTAIVHQDTHRPVTCTQLLHISAGNTKHKTIICSPSSTYSLTPFLSFTNTWHQTFNSAKSKLNTSFKWSAV